MENRFNLLLTQKKGEAKIKVLVGVVVVLILVSHLAPTALIGLFNSSAFLYINGNESLGLTGIPSWVPSILGILGVVAFIYIMINVAKR